MRGKQLTLLTIAAFVLVFSFASVSALQERISITMSETVNQNTTYAENFDLVEQTTFCQINGVVNLTNPTNATTDNQTVADIYLTFTNVENMETNFSLMPGGRNGAQVAGSAGTLGGNITLHVVELRAGDWSAFNYTINCSGGTLEPPLNVSTNYLNAETGITTKVLAGHEWTLNQSVQNDLAGGTITNINLTIQSQNVTWNGTADWFNLTTLNATGDFANVLGNGTNTSTWYWLPNAGTLTSGSSTYIVYNVSSPWQVPTSNSYLAIVETLQYQAPILASNLSLIEVTGIADVEYSLNKQIVRPADDVLNNNVTWEVASNVSVPFNISYNLTTVSLWVTEDLDLTNTSTYGGSPLETNYTVDSIINQSNIWSNNGNEWQFNFTDASNNLSARPPIVWMKPYFTILNAYGQITNSSITQNGNDFYMKYIYVVNGYWLQIDKNITSIANDQYFINTTVKNVGNAWTPQGLVVTVYDFIPTNFTAWNFSKAYDSNQTVSGSGFDGEALRWSLYPLNETFNASLGPVGSGYDVWEVAYNVNGTGEYKVSELYIVGLDPRNVDGAGTHEGITLISGLGSGGSEFFYLAIVFFLVVINVVNFVMTRRINQRLDSNGKHK